MGYCCDIKSSHVNPRFNDDFILFIYFKCRNTEIREVKETRVKTHSYLGMTLVYYEKGKVNIDMRDYVKKMINYFPIKLDKNNTATTPANENLF